MSDREFLKLFSGLMGALIALSVVLFILAQIMGARAKPAQEVMNASAEARAIAERIKPIGEVTVNDKGPMNGIIATANAAGADKGKTVYDQACFACHGAGVAGAPKLGDKTAWKDRVAKGNAALYNNAIKGFQGKGGVMPPKGGAMHLPDADVKAAVDFMVSQSK